MTRGQERSAKKSPVLARFQHKRSHVVVCNMTSGPLSPFVVPHWACGTWKIMPRSLLCNALAVAGFALESCRTWRFMSDK